MSAPPRPNLRVTLPEVMTSGDVARVLGIAKKSVVQHDDVLKPFRTLGSYGHRRYLRAIVAEVAERPLDSRWSRQRKLAERRALARKARKDLSLYLNCLQPGVPDSEEQAARYLDAARTRIGQLADLNSEITGSAVTP